jgi:cellulose synthase (UDP-forming)
MWIWSGGTAVVWVGAAVYRLFTGYPPDFALVLSSGLFYALVVARALIQPKEHHAEVRPQELQTVGDTA